MPPTQFVYSGINFTFPSYQASGNDSVRASGQNIPIPSAKYFNAHFLAASEGGSLTEGAIAATYADGSTESSTVLVPVWWYDYLFGGDIIFPFYFSKDGVDWNKSMIYLVSTNLDSSKELVSLQMPTVSSGIHIFSLSMWPAVGTTNSSLEIQSARSTQKWMGDKNVQIVEVLINNVGTQWVTSNDTVQVSIQSTGYETVTPATIKRLRPGDQVKVEVGVTLRGEVGSTGKATVVISGKNTYATYDFQATFGVIPYESTFESTYSHESPAWYDGSKYGIFIHWGLYSIPAWGSSGSNETYAEWYVSKMPFLQISFVNKLGTGGI
jgi:alpha-L-fucosidase